MKRMYVIFCLLCIMGTAIAEKILIITHSYCRPDFIELQAATFKAFLQDEYEYVVFNDASDEGMRVAIDSMCERLGIRCFRIPQEMHQIPGRTSPGHRHMDGIQYSFDLIGYDHDGIVMLIDSDMFLIKPFNAHDYLGEYHFIGGVQSRENDQIKVTYVAPTVVFMNMKTAPNKKMIRFEGGYIHGLACDVGAHMYYYLRDTENLSYRFFIAESTDRLPRDVQALRDLGYDELAAQFTASLKGKYGFEFHADDYFFHYRAGGSNWPGYGENYLRAKDRMLHYFINASMQKYGVN